MIIDEFYSLPRKQRHDELFKCCGSTHWVVEMMNETHAENEDELLEQAEECWSRCDADDWREAFTHHPKIGDVNAIAQKFANTAQWAASEQREVSHASDETIRALSDGNKEYEEKFGYIFIVCATGKSADEMLELLKQRLPNAHDVEIRIAAQEQLKITKLRLQKLLAP